MNCFIGKVGFSRAKSIRDSIFIALSSSLVSPIIKTHLVRNNIGFRKRGTNGTNDVYYYRVPNCNLDKHQCALLRG